MVARLKFSPKDLLLQKYHTTDRMYYAQASQSHNDITKIYSKPSQSCREKILSETTKEKMSRLGLSRLRTNRD